MYHLLPLMKCEYLRFTWLVSFSVWFSVCWRVTFTTHIKFSLVVRQCDADKTPTVLHNLVFVTVFRGSCGSRQPTGFLCNSVTRVPTLLVNTKDKRLNKTLDTPRLLLNLLRRIGNVFIICTWLVLGWHKRKQFSKNQKEQFEHLRFKLLNNEPGLTTNTSSLFVDHQFIGEIYVIHLMLH